MMLPKTVTVEVDTREKTPILFPSTVTVYEARGRGRPSQHRITVKTKRVRLDAGDYRLREFPDTCIIERKAGIRELTKNLLDPRDRRRQGRAFKRLEKACSHPYLLVEASPADLLTVTPHVKEPERTVELMVKVLVDYGFHLIVARRSSSATIRRITGTMLVHLMLGHAANLIRGI